jgi:uncharacterized protein
MRRDGLIDLNDALQHPGRRVVEEFSIRLPSEEGLALDGPVTGELSAISTGNALILSLQATAQVLTECAQCGRPVMAEIAFEMEDDFAVEGLPSAYAKDGFAKVVDDEPFPLFHENSLIRDAYVRQGVILNLPLRSECPPAEAEACAAISQEPELEEEPQGPASPLLRLKGLIEPREETA